MSKYAFVIILLIYCATGYSQRTPYFKENVKVNAGIDSIFRSQIKEYDLLVAIRLYSNWSSPISQTFDLFKFSKNQTTYYEVTVNDKRSPSTLFSPAAELSLKKIFRADSVLQGLSDNNLFSIEDDKIYPECNEKDSIINGKTTRRFAVEISDGPEYSVWIITPKKSRHLYYYAPQYYADKCPGDRKKFVKILAVLKDLEK